MASVDLKKMKNLLDEAKRKKDARGILWFSPKVGKNKIRILPRKGESTSFFKEVHQHNELADRPIPCLKDIKEDCPACEAVEKLFKSGDAGDIELAKKIRAKARYFYSILDRGTPNADPTPMVLGSGPMIWEQLLAFFGDDEWGDITDPKKGFDVIIEREGEGQTDTRYKVRPTREPSAVANFEKIQEKAIDLDTLVEYISADKMKEIMEGSAEAASDDGEEEPEEDEAEETEDEEAEDSEEPKKEASEEESDEEEEDSEDEESDDEDRESSSDDSGSDDDSDEDSSEDGEDDEEEPPSKPVSKKAEKGKVQSRPVVKEAKKSLPPSKDEDKKRVNSALDRLRGLKKK